MISREKLEEVVKDYEIEVSQASVSERQIFKALDESLALEEVTAIAGVRRSGKTFLMYELMQKHGGIYVNFENEKLVDFTVEDFDKLYSIAIENDKKILFLDEVQNVKAWEKFASRIHKKIKVIASGSNSSFLSSEFATALTGRTITFALYPLSFKEALEFKAVDAGKMDSAQANANLEKYLKLGGFPRIVATENLELAHEYFKLIIYRDVIPRFRIKMTEAINRLAVYLVSNAGKPFSYRKLSEYCGLGHETTTREYVSYLEQAFLVSTVNAFDYSLKKQEIKPKKIYSIDPAFNAIGLSPTSDKGRLLENVVFLELKRRLKANDKIFYYKNEYEADFVTTHGLKPFAIYNVAYETSDEKTFEREVKSLEKTASELKTKNNYLISMHPPKHELPKTITYINAASFLLNKE